MCYILARNFFLVPVSIITSVKCCVQLLGLLLRSMKNLSLYETDYTIRVANAAVFVDLKGICLAVITTLQALSPIINFGISLSHI